MISLSLPCHSDPSLRHLEGGDLDANKRKILKGESSCFSGDGGEIKRKKLDSSSPAAVVQLAYAQPKDGDNGAAEAAANATSFIDEEMNAYFPTAADSLEGDSVAHREKLSQLRQLLEKNLKPSGGAGSGAGAAPGSSAFRPTALLPLSEAAEHDDKLPAAIAVTVGECCCAGVLQKRDRMHYNQPRLMLQFMSISGDAHGVRVFPFPQIVARIGTRLPPASRTTKLHTRSPRETVAPLLWAWRMPPSPSVASASCRKM